MGWFRRRHPAPVARTTEAVVRHEPTGPSTLPVPVATAPALERTERALQMLAAQSAELHASLMQLEGRVEALSDVVIDQIDRPSYDDVLAARLHSAKVAGELARLEVNIAAKLEAVRNDVRTLAGDEPAEIDLRGLSPVDTGW